MITRVRPYPVLLAFLLFLTGIVAAGMLGEAHAAVLALAIAIGAEMVTRIRGLRQPRLAWILTGFFVLGAVRLDTAGTAVESRGANWPEAALQQASESSGRMTAAIRVERIIQRDLTATRALVQVQAIRDDDGWIPMPPGAGFLLRLRGLAGIMAGGEYVVRGRLLRPRPGSEALSPAWPRFPPIMSFLVSGPSDLFPVIRRAGGVPSLLEQARMALTGRIAAVLEGDAADFALAILLGEGGGIDPAIRTGLSSLGTAHVLAVSGLHVAAAALVVGFLVSCLIGPVLARMNPRIDLAAIRFATAAAAALGMAALAGMTPSAQRASIMISLAFMAALSGRRQGIEGLISLVGLASLVMEPADAFSLSFLLSYSAVLEIAALTRPLSDLILRSRPLEERMSSGWGRYVVLAFCGSLAATLSTTPLTLFAFGTAGLAGPAANLVVLPLMSLVVMPLALLVLGVGAISQDLLLRIAPAIQWVFSTFLHAQDTVASRIPAINWSGCPAGFSLVVAGCVGCVGLLVFRRPAAGVLAGGFGLVAALSYGPAPPVRPADTLSVTFFDAGKGDAILVRCPTGRNYLVDTAEEARMDGPWGVVTRLRRSGVSHLDGVLVTHGDTDHSGGLLRLARGIDIGEVVVPCPEAVRNPLREMLSRLEGRGIPSRCVVSGMEVLQGCGEVSRVLWPPPFRNLSSNASSLVLKINWAGRSVLLTGDLGSKQETELVSRGVDVRADVLKLSHHGSKGGSSRTFLEAVQPSVTVVSGWLGGTSAGIPAEVRDRIARLPARIYSTRALRGLTIHLSSHGVNIQPGQW